MFALSSVSNIGFLLIALYINTPLGIEAYLFYMFIYLITLVFLFMIFINIGYLKHKYRDLDLRIYPKSSPIQTFSDLIGLSKNNSFLALSFTICLLSLLGIPPFIGFFLKQKVILSALANGYFLISFIAILTSVISAVYYLKIIEYIYFKEGSFIKRHVDITMFEKLQHKYEDYFILTNEISFLIAFFTLSLTFFIIHPNFILNSAEILALTYFIN